jgi:hypothetical protein
VAYRLASKGRVEAARHREHDAEILNLRRPFGSTDAVYAAGRGLKR